MATDRPPLPVGRPALACATSPLQSSTASSGTPPILAAGASTLFPPPPSPRSALLHSLEEHELTTSSDVSSSTGAAKRLRAHLRRRSTAAHRSHPLHFASANRRTCNPQAVSSEFSIPPFSGPPPTQERPQPSIRRRTTDDIPILPLRRRCPTHNPPPVGRASSEAQTRRPSPSLSRTGQPTARRRSRVRPPPPLTEPPAPSAPTIRHPGWSPSPPPIFPPTHIQPTSFSFNLPNHRPHRRPPLPLSSLPSPTKPNSARLSPYLLHAPATARRSSTDLSVIHGTARQRQPVTPKPPSCTHALSPTTSDTLRPPPDLPSGYPSLIPSPPETTVSFPIPPTYRVLGRLWNCWLIEIIGLGFVGVSLVFVVEREMLSYAMLWREEP